ncbi:MAG: hypothetical protein CL609_23690 [Anaerolineaceae bacterium]|nr:hypothetical protein [Anaerolineaceae bacterium]
MNIDLLKNNVDLITILISLGAFLISGIAVFLSYLGYRMSKKSLEENLKLEIFTKYENVNTKWSDGAGGQIWKTMLTIQVKIMNIGQQPVKLSSIIFYINKRPFSDYYFSHYKTNQNSALPSSEDLMIEPHQQRTAYISTDEVLKMQPDSKKYSVQVKITSEINNVFLSKKAQFTPKDIVTDPNIEKIKKMVKTKSE